MKTEMTEVVKEPELDKLEDFFEPQFSAMEPMIVEN